MLPSLMALRCFELSARHASFTRAAQELHVTQGAVSHQVLGLEAQLGTPLFVRRKAGLQLTAAGRTYWTEVSAALRQLERATQNLMLNKGMGGALNLCGASSFATYWLMPRLADFVMSHPEVTLNLSTHIGPVDFSAAAHDAAIEYCAGAEPGLHADFVHALTLRPYCAPLLPGAAPRGRRPRSDRDRLVRILSEQPLISHTTVPEAWPAWLARAQLTARITESHRSTGPRYDLLSMALNGAIAGLGVALLPDYLTTTAVQAGQLVQLAREDWTSPKAYYLRFPLWKAELPALESFRRWVQSQVGTRAGPRSGALLPDTGPR